ncbi:MFS transporter [Ruania rhizosphaerae]|uniref:MFS transporter n=1 Tax=Ruania rhizosphaerae TaxID=1840413 RepID=UPI00190F9780|nr:MFS transporter [Ruania rhizosphaerae]
MSETMVDQASELNARQRWTVMVVCALALFLVGLDTTIVTIGLPQIAAGVSADPGRMAWVIDAYTVVFASLLITAGALADRFGRRRVFRTGLVVFGLASLACAVAPSLGFLIVARLAQGAGASMLSPVALAIVVNVMRDPAERARAIGVWGAVFGLSMAAGPVTGGALIAAFDWRAVFWINLPVVGVALLLVAAVVPESRGLRVRRLDIPGQLLLVLLLGGLVALLIEGPRLGWLSPVVIVAYVLVLVVAIVFVLVESRSREPLIAPSLFRVASFTGAVLGAVAIFVAFSLTLLVTTVLLQEGSGRSALAAGALTLPMAVAATVFAPISGSLVARVGPRLPLLGAGVAVVAAGVCLLIALSVWGPGLNVPLLVVGYVLLGVGVGLANAPITNTAVSGLPPDRAGVAGGTASTARQLGTALGVALGGSLVAQSAPEDLATGTLAGWLVVMLCGGILILVSRTARPATSVRSAQG